MPSLYWWYKIGGTLFALWTQIFAYFISEKLLRSHTQGQLSIVDYLLVLHSFILQFCPTKILPSYVYIGELNKSHSSYQ